jgi:hypothetical protein
MGTCRNRHSGQFWVALAHEERKLDSRVHHIYTITTFA